MMDYARYTVEAPPAFVMNLLVSRGAHLKKIAKKDRELTFSVERKSAAKVEEALNKQNVAFTLVSVTGPATAFKNGVKRYGLIAGVIIGVILAALYYLSLTAVKIEGADKVDEQQILDVLLEKGVKTPALFVELDCKSLAEEILSIEGVSAATVSRKGTRLIVRIEEELSESEIIDTDTPAPLIASEDGVITRIVTLKGTALVKAGDTVRKGDVLIAPYTYDINGNKIPVRAMGDVYARVWYQEHTVYQDKVMAEVRTGRKEEKTAAVIFGLRYTPKSSFLNYNIEVREKTVNAVIPFKIVTVTFYETEVREIDFNFDEKAAGLILDGMKRLKDSLPKGAKAARNWYIVKRLDNSTILSIYYEVEQKIV